MRFLMLMIPKDYGTASPDARPSADAVAAMMQYNKALGEAGALISLEGLHPPASGARVTFVGSNKPAVTHGPFPEAKEGVGGFWMIDVKSQEEAIAWAERCPVFHDAVIEIRQVMEMSDFPPDVQEAAAGFTDMQKKS